MKPVGMSQKLKNNAKNERANTAWQKSKRENRPYQMFDEATGKRQKIMEPQKVTE